MLAAASLKVFLILFHLVSTGVSSSLAPARTWKRFLTSRINCFWILGHLSFAISNCFLCCSCLIALRSFSFTVATTKLWSLAASAPRNTLTFSSDRRHFPLMIIYMVNLVKGSSVRQPPSELMDVLVGEDRTSNYKVIVETEIG